MAASALALGIAAIALLAPAASAAGPAGGLPDNRSYEQATPVQKNGDDAEGDQRIVKAAADGNGITFLSTFGFPGGVGAQSLPTYLASREAGGWSTRGLLPPASLGEAAKVLGYAPDFSVTYASVAKYEEPVMEAFVALPKGKPPELLTPYMPTGVKKELYRYVGSTPDDSVVFFEARAKLPPREGAPPIPDALGEAPNLYAWDRESGEVSLVSVGNEEEALPKGGFAGPYDWGRGTTALWLGKGGSEREYYLQDTHAITSEGDAYFTEAGSGQLYLRENPTEPQSPMEGGKCAKPQLACTVHVSASARSTEPDPAGPQPAAFQAASADGKSVFFTSPELLTDNANTGPEQPKPAISRGKLEGEEVKDVEPAFIPKSAIGLAEDSEYLYWADPGHGSIGRAKLGEPASADDSFIVPGPAGCGAETEPGVFEEEAESSPRYVAVDSEHIYWTNTGCAEVAGEKDTEGHGTIGRAKLDGEAASIEPVFIPGKVEESPGVFKVQVANPQGIAVDATHIYWANHPYDPVGHTIARASIEGEEVEAEFFTPTFGAPFGVAVSGDDEYLYFTSDEENNNNGYVSRILLASKEEKGLFYAGHVATRGVTLEGSHVYWASQAAGKGAIGRCNLELKECTAELLEVEGAPNGVAADAEHLHWSVNGETSLNPGNDLYRFEPESGQLSDLSADAGPEDGAEAQGVLGASADGKRVYFAANAVLDAAEEGSPGDCESVSAHGLLNQLSGHCNLYLWEEAEGTEAIRFVARLDVGEGMGQADWYDWAPTPRVGNGYLPRTSRVSQDGKALLFRSREKLTAYENEGVPELYLYREGAPEPISCVSCDPQGEAPGKGPLLGQITFVAGLWPGSGIASVMSRNLSADGRRAFFETSESLVPGDTNGEAQDVYEWEAPGEGSCAVSSPAYHEANQGCLYLISTGSEERPSLFGDASESGNDVFFFTFSRLVGQDQDELRDVYDARVGGGLASQNPPPPPPPCESAESCHGPAQGTTAEATPGSAGFVGPPNPEPKRPKKKAKHHRKRHARHHRKHGHKAKQHRRAHAKPGAGK